MARVSAPQRPATPPVHAGASSSSTDLGDGSRRPGFAGPSVHRERTRRVGPGPCARLALAQVESPMYRVLTVGDLVCRGKEPPAVWNPGEGLVGGSLPLFVGLPEPRAPSTRPLRTVNRERSRSYFRCFCDGSRLSASSPSSSPKSAKGFDGRDRRATPQKKRAR